MAQPLSPQPTTKRQRQHQALAPPQPAAKRARTATTADVSAPPEEDAGEDGEEARSCSSSESDGDTEKYLKIGYVKVAAAHHRKGLATLLLSCIPKHIRRLARAGAVLQGLLTLRAPAPPEADAGPHPADGDAGTEQAGPDRIDAEDALELPAGPAA